MQENKTRTIIIILIVLIILITVIGTVLYITTDLLKSKEVLFQKYIAQNVQNIADVFDVSTEEETIDLLRSSDYTESTEAVLTYLESQNDEHEVFNIEETGIIKNSEDSSYRNISVAYGDTELINIDLLERDNMYGLRLANLVQQFVTVENASVSYFISSLGYDGQYFSETMQEVDISGLFDFSDDEIETLTDTYVNIIFSDIEKDSYSSKSNSLITLNNGQSVTTSAYSLTLTQNELDVIYKKILNQAIKDEIILDKLEFIDNKIEETGLVEQEGESLKELYISKLQEILDSMSYTGTDTRETVFTVYVEDDTTVRTLIKSEEYEIQIDLDNTSGKTMSLKIIELTNEGTNEKTYELGKAEEDTEITRKISYNDDTKNFELNIDYSQQEDSISVNTNLDYSDNKITDLSIESNSNVTFEVTEAIPIYFNDSNNILLNEYDGDRVLSILDNLKNRLITSLENNQLNINSKMLNNMLLYIDEKEQEREQEELNNIEIQKSRFNNQFILYEGEDIEYEYILKLLKTVGQNMSDYEVVSGTQIKIYIEDGTENEEKAEEIINALSDRLTYNVSIGYSDSGYVETIDLQVYED